ncbi:MAG: SCO family protein [Anaerolineae bacterium]|nr:SCO family protein [Anaerolineae bacterium]
MKQNKNNLSWLYLLIAGLISAIGIVIGYILVLALTTPTEDSAEMAFVQTSANTGVTAIEPAVPVEDFTLTDQNGEEFGLSDLQGKPTLLSWGYTHCPDICPLTLREMRQIREDLGEEAEAVNFVFISVDGERDTPQVLNRYFGALDVAFVHGLTGDPATVREIGTPLGVDFAYTEPDENGFYNVNHTAGMFLLDADGNWIRRYTYGIDRRTLVNDLEDFLSR